AQVLSAGALRPADCRFLKESDADPTLGYLDMLKASFNQSDVSPRLLSPNHPRRVKLLLLDDLASSNLTPNWGRPEMSKLIEGRHADNLATILTSNFDLDGLAVAIDPRITSRIAESRLILELPQCDLRIVGTVQTAPVALLQQQAEGTRQNAR
ncbi:MAG: hypothetical protein PHU85_14600, partial [Phycisphaerae bacterium]|nr:hypothetical protein [Phycisphaerae bacterium]